MNNREKKPLQWKCESFNDQLKQSREILSVENLFMNKSWNECVSNYDQILLFNVTDPYGLQNWVQNIRLLKKMTMSSINSNRT